ncbi:MAG: hypothetical protein LBT75_01910 [Bacilli bacterium]|jgi:hypothetical protein|nr:hypothetical protein [Bacilli bacterium]
MKLIKKFFIAIVITIGFLTANNNNINASYCGLHNYVHKDIQKWTNFIYVGQDNTIAAGARVYSTTLNINQKTYYRATVKLNNSRYIYVGAIVNKGKTSFASGWGPFTPHVHCGI